jgi:transcriptional regulator with XRE-family HTH domain
MMRVGKKFGTRFGAELARLRAEAGFSGAHAFFKARGGRKAFGMAFTNYLNIEQGNSLPKGERVSVFAAALGLPPGSDALRGLLLAFLADHLGSKVELGFLRGEGDPAPSSWLLSESAARQAVQGRSVQLSLEQYGALAADAGAYACHALLVNTRGGLTKDALAAEVGLGTRPLDAALSRLKAAGLLKMDGERLLSPYQGKYVVPPIPRLTPELAGCYSRMREHRLKWVEEGSGLDARYLILRAGRGKFARYLQHLADVVSMSALYGDVEPGPGSEMYLVEGRVTRIFKSRADAAVHA